MQPYKKMWFKVSVEEEFAKNPELNKDDLDSLREWALSQRHFPPVPDEMLIFFLHSCYFNIKKAQSCMDCYLTIRSSAPSVFCNRDVNDPELRKYRDTLNITPLPVLDPKGYRVFYHGLRDCDPANYNQVYDSKMSYMATDLLLFQDGTSPGFVIIMDLKGSKIGHLAKVNLTMVRIGSKYVQEGSPLRLKAIHIVNVTSWIDKLMAVLRPFLKNGILEMIHFHKEGSTTLHDYIPKECLPCELGGTLPSVDVLSDENLKQLEAYADIFLEDEKLRIDESKRTKSTRKSAAVQELPTQFKMLEID